MWPQGGHGNTFPSSVLSYYGQWREYLHPEPGADASAPTFAHTHGDCDGVVNLLQVYLRHCVPNLRERLW